MPNFTFQGRSTNGQLVDGEVEGADSAAVSSLLMERGVIPISIMEKKHKQDIDRGLSAKNTNSI